MKQHVQYVQTIIHRSAQNVTDVSFFCSEDPSFSGPSGIFDWRLVSSLGTHSLFVGLNYPINQEITDGKDHDGSAVSSSGKTVCTQHTMRLSMHHTLICAGMLCSPK